MSGIMSCQSGLVKALMGEGKKFGRTRIREANFNRDESRFKTWTSAKLQTRNATNEVTFELHIFELSCWQTEEGGGQYRELEHLRNEKWWENPTVHNFHPEFRNIPTIELWAAGKREVGGMNGKIVVVSFRRWSSQKIDFHPLILVNMLDSRRSLFFFFFNFNYLIVIQKFWFSVEAVSLYLMSDVDFRDRFSRKSTIFIRSSMKADFYRYFW